jgi:hypothetical protein
MRKLFFVALLVFALVPSSVLSQRASVWKQFPVYDNGGKPDLVVDPQRFVAHMEIVDRLFAEGSSAIEEGAVGGAGYRRILRFDTVVMNSGNGDLVVGDRSDPIRGFSDYVLLNTSRMTVVAGHKQGFVSRGIASGRSARFNKQLTGQWIDITGVPEGDYIVRVTVNAAGTFDEGQNRYTNSVETSIHVPDPGKKVTIDNSPEVPDK